MTLSRKDSVLVDQQANVKASTKDFLRSHELLPVYQQSRMENLLEYGTILDILNLYFFNGILFVLLLSPC